MNLNQCDGCKLGLPIEQGIHIHPTRQGWSRYHMVCSAEDYVDPRQRCAICGKDKGPLPKGTTPACPVKVYCMTCLKPN